MILTVITDVKNYCSSCLQKLHIEADYNINIAI